MLKLFNKPIEKETNLNVNFSFYAEVKKHNVSQNHSGSKKFDPCYSAEKVASVCEEINNEIKNKFSGWSKEVKFTIKVTLEGKLNGENINMENKFTTLASFQDFLKDNSLINKSSLQLTN